MASAQILNNSKAMYVWNGTNWLPLNGQNFVVNSTRWQKIANGGETSLSGVDDNGSILYYSPGYEQVFLNGILLVRNDDYTANDGLTITNLAPISASANIEIIALKQLTLANTYTRQQLEDKLSSTFDRWTKTISASATVLSGLDDNNLSLIYNPGFEQVYVNGILLAPEEYVATSGSTVVLDESVISGDIVQIHNFEVIGLADTYRKSEVDDLLDNIDLSATIQTASTAAVTYLVDSAPAALDTLNEISAALNDNPNVLNLYLTQANASVIYATKAEVAIIDVDNLPDTFLMMGG